MAFGIGLLINLLPTRVIIGTVTAIGVTLLRPTLLILGMTKALEICCNKNPPPTTMNFPSDLTADIPPTPTPSNVANKIEDCVRSHPTSSLLGVLGMGLLAVVLIRVLNPPPPQNRAVRLLEDIQHRLATLAEDGADMVGKGAHSFGDMNLDRQIHKVSRSIKNLFH